MGKEAGRFGAMAKGERKLRGLEQWRRGIGPGSGLLSLACRARQNFAWNFSNGFRARGKSLGHTLTGEVILV
jgi:hypothetical protein